MLAPQVLCNLCRGHIDNDGFHLRSGQGLMSNYEIAKPIAYSFSELPFTELQVHVCDGCLQAMKKLLSSNN